MLCNTLYHHLFLSLTRGPPISTLFPYTTLFRSWRPSRTSAITARYAIALKTILQRSEEHTSELQSLRHLVCRLLLEKKKQTHTKGTENCLTTGNKDVVDGSQYKRLA